MLKDSIKRKLETLVERYEEVTVMLSDPGIIADQAKFRDLSKEYSQLEPIFKTYKQYDNVLTNIAHAQLLEKDEDPELRALATEELHTAKSQCDSLEQAIQVLLLPRNADDERNVYIEIRAAAGGDEAAIFAGDLFRMYARFAEHQGWQVEIVTSHSAEQGGYKEIIGKISGQNVYAKLKFESGAHRVQRVPVTETQGRVHTSTCTVAIMPEVDEIGEIDIKTDDLRIDTYRASGAGGQHVNKTDSAIRITHLPTGIVVECQDERSQHKNRAKALSLLKSKLLSEEQSRQRQEQADQRRSLVGTGDRSERIRTYNYSQGRVTDHRINLTLYKLPEIMEGDLAEVIEPLSQEYQAELLANLSES